MSTRIFEHIRANVVGYVAIFLFAIGGTAYATHPGGANTISSVDIIDNEVQAADLGTGAVANTKLGTFSVSSSKISPNSISSSTKVAPDVLTGGDISEATLSGQVCPSTMLFHEGACIEKTKRASTTFGTANTTCQQAGRRLPSLEELMTFRLRPGQDMSATAEHTQFTWVDDGPSAQSVWQNLVHSSGALTRRRLSQNHSAPYRCVSTPT